MPQRSQHLYRFIQASPPFREVDPNRGIVLLGQSRDPLRPRDVRRTSDRWLRASWRGRWAPHDRKCNRRREREAWLRVVALIPADGTGEETWHGRLGASPRARRRATRRSQRCTLRSSRATVPRWSRPRRSRSRRGGAGARSSWMATGSCWARRRHCSPADQALAGLRKRPPAAVACWPRRRVAAPAAGPEVELARPLRRSGSSCWPSELRVGPVETMAFFAPPKSSPQGRLR